MSDINTLDDLFQHAVTNFPHGRLRTQIPTEDTGTDYAEKQFFELGEMSNQIASSLQRHGIGPGDKVAIVGKPHPRWASIFFAVVKIGAIAVPIASNLTGSESRRILQESGAKIAAVPSSYQEKILTNNSLIPNLKDIIVYRGKPAPAAKSWSSFLSQEADFTPAELSPQDTAAIMYTSGTMGNAKGVMLSHKNLVTNVSDLHRLIDISADDVAGSILPWYHIYGLTVTLFTPLQSGTSIFYTEEYRNLPFVLKQNNVTILVGVPKLFNLIYKEVRNKIESNLLIRLALKITPRIVRRRIKQEIGGPHLRFVVSGGAPLDPEVATELRNLGVGIYEGYGLTETSPVLTWTPDPLTTKKGSVGVSLPHVDLKIDTDKQGGVSEVIVRGAVVMQGYYKNERKTSEVIDDEGWFHTGDSGWLDEDNWLHLNGRKNNVIVLQSGNNVYPEEVEWELERLPYIKEALVREKQRMGQPVVSASVYPDFESLAREKGLKEREEIAQFFWKSIKKGCKNLAPYKRIKSKRDFELREKPFQKTPTLKIKRHLYQG